MEIGAKHWLITVTLAMMLHGYAIWHLQRPESSAPVTENVLTQYTIDLTTFQTPPQPIKLDPVPPPPPKVVPKPKPKPAPVVKPEFEKPVQQPVVEPVEPSPAPPPKVASPPVTTNVAKTNYYGLIVDKLEREKRYPSRARRRDEQGTVRLTFTLNKDGSLQDYAITKSSGSRILDREVERLIKRVAPFPAVPQNVSKGSIELSVDLSFRLQ